MGIHRQMTGRRGDRGVNVVDVGCFLVLVICCITICAADSSKCDTCRDLARRFNEGIEKTAGSNFGGGNTRWEETKLGSYTFSETRLIEVLEYSCQDGTKECHHMLEENEELLENWWFTLYAKGQEQDLHAFLCLNTLKVCCPEGTYGPECTECPTGKDKPCSGNGRCEGSGTREGTGSCVCNSGYQGDICNECSTSKYFEEVKNETHTICTACHYSCQTSCSGAGPALCGDCISGWSFVDGQGCVECNYACDGCTGSGPENCVECRQKFFHDGTECKACHKSCSTSCSDESPKSCNECAKGWQRNVEESECQDIDECATESSDCSADSYCVNTEGSFYCPKCDKTCDGCIGPTNKDCNECRVGYARNEENECQDVDECHAVEGTCSAPGERCVNTLGSYSCSCQDGFVRRSGKCVVKPKENKKKKKQAKIPKTEENKFGTISPENLADEIKKLGKPIQGVPIEQSEDEMVTMGGKFEIPTKDSSASAEKTGNTDSTQDKQKHDDL